MTFLLLGGVSETILYINQPYIYVIFLLYALIKTRNKILFWKGECISIWIIFILTSIYLSFGLLYSIDIEYTKRYISFFILYFSISYLYLNINIYIIIIKYIRVVSVILAVSIIFSAVIGESFYNTLYFWFLDKERIQQDLYAGRATGLIGNVTFAAYAMSTGLSAWFANIMISKKNIGNYIAMTICFVALMVTGKRIMLFMAIIPFSINLFYTNRKTSKKIIGILATALIMCGIAIFFIPRARLLLRRFMIIDDYSTFNGRTELWRIALRMLHESPMFGTGIGTFMTFNEMYGTHTRHLAHSHYMQILAETGYIGIILFSALFVLGLRLTIVAVHISYKNGEIEAWSIALFAMMSNISFLLSGLVGGSFYYLQNGVLYALSLAMSACILNKVNSKAMKHRE